MKKILARPHLQEYRNRDYVQTFLDDRHFDALNEMDDSQACALAMATCGCIDALDNIPAGSMESFGEKDRWYDQTMASREFDMEELAERDALATQLIAEMMRDFKE